MLGQITAEPSGRWPANLILSHAPECRLIGTKKVDSSKATRGASTRIYGGGKGFTVATGEKVGYADEEGKETVENWECVPWCPVAMLDEMSGILHGHGSTRHSTGAKHGLFTMGEGIELTQIGGESGGASRFFYTAKASSTERNKGCDHLYWKKDKSVPSGFIQITEKEWQSLPKKQRAEGNVHPTVKPLELLQYLTRLTRTPTGGIVLDPFMGSGSQGKATILEDRSFIGIEIEEASFVIAEARIEYTWIETEEGMEP